ncbi:uncharacterized protein LOC143919578 [Arctopsyche grandis]|uniref:uncharacterized protein LOC143919578 n=1 Tax=Arctopsyche grandis TaxID=121162 RepID=UPI00406D6884
MVRTRSSARLADHTQPEEGSSESNYVSLEKLEKLEKQLGRKRLKTKSRSATTNVNPSAPVAETSVVTPYHTTPSTSTGFVHTSSSDAHGFNLYQSSFHQRLQLQTPMSMSAHYQMLQMLDNSVKSPVNSYPVHPDVKFKRLPFYDLISELIKPSTLMNHSSEYRTQDFHFNFTPQETTTLAMESDMMVQLRFCLLETSCEQDDCFPTNLTVKVNGKFCQLPMPIPSNKVIMEPKRPPGPVHITHLIKKSAMQTNTISVTWKADYVRQYAVCVSLVRMLTSSQLLARLKNKGTKHSDFTRSLIKEKLREDLDCEIATTSLRVSLVCPLGKMRMVCPCRPATCLHLQCFDASLFLQMNERKSSWICPVCDKPALYDVLVVDGYFQDVLNSSRLDKDCTEIQLHKDGSWSVHSKEAIPENTINDSTTNVELIPDDIDIIPLSDGSESSTGLPSLKRTPTGIFTSSISIVNEVLLISDDSDDDDLPLKKRTPNPPDVSESVSIEVPCDPSYITADSTTSQDLEYGDSVLVTGVYNSRERSSSIITLDSPSPPEAPASPVVEVTTPPQAIVAPFHPEPDPLPIEPSEPIESEENSEIEK